MNCYLDNSATTRCFDSVAELTARIMCKDYGNPSSLHLQGQDKTMFLEYVDAWGVVMGSCTADNFINGFRLGAKFAYDTFVGADDLVTGSGKGA